eukprot:4368516-Pleurochrysis_carterae.AAC.2
MCAKTMLVISVIAQNKHDMPFGKPPVTTRISSQPIGRCPELVLEQAATSPCYLVPRTCFHVTTWRLGTR